jgi:hypothetical protein
VNYIVSGLEPKPFQPLFALSDDALRQHGIQRCVAEDDGYPCRISLAHADIDEELLLLSYEHQAANSPYRAKGPIFVRKSATKAAAIENGVPEPFRIRLLSVRAYDRNDCIVEAEVLEGAHVEPIFKAWLAREDVAYLHVHYARRGCYAGRVDRR